MSSLRAPWQNGPYKKPTHRTTQKHNTTPRRSRHLEKKVFIILFYLKLKLKLCLLVPSVSYICKVCVMRRHTSVSLLYDYMVFICRVFCKRVQTESSCNR